MFDITLQKQPGHFDQAIKNKNVIERYREWHNFERTHTTATKKQILDFAKMLDKKYAEIFQL